MVVSPLAGYSSLAFARYLCVCTGATDCAVRQAAPSTDTAHGDSNAEAQGAHVALLHRELAAVNELLEARAVGP